MSPKPKLVFFGNERLATGVSTVAPTLHGLLEAGYEIEAVVINQSHGLSRRRREVEVEVVAHEYDLPVYKPANKRELTELCTSFTAAAGVLVAFGMIVPAAVIEHFPRGIVNIHPSLLPAWRGSTPLEQTILDSPAETGVSLMQLDAGMDTGAVYVQQTVPLEAHISKQELATRLGAVGATLLVEHLPQILAGELEPAAQHDELATYTTQITKGDGQIDWTKPATHLEREVRAYLGWPGSFCELNGKQLTVTACNVLEASGTPGEAFVHHKQLAVYCGEGALLIERLKPAGKAEMTSQAYLAGNPLPR